MNEISTLEKKLQTIEQKDGMYVVPLGNGAVADNAGILEVKLAKIGDPNKQKNVQKELEQYLPGLTELRKNFPAIEEPYNRLCELHNMLWDIEDQKRQIEKGREEEEFVAHILEEDPEVLKRYLVLCRQVSKYNDERATVKRRINDITGSKIVEEKSHTTVSV